MPLQGLHLLICQNIYITSKYPLWSKMDPKRQKNWSCRIQTKPTLSRSARRVDSDSIFFSENGLHMAKISRFEVFSKHAKKSKVKVNSPYYWRQQYDLHVEDDIKMMSACWHGITRGWHVSCRFGIFRGWCGKHVDYIEWHVAVRTMTWPSDSLLCGSTDDRLAMTWLTGGRLQWWRM